MAITPGIGCASMSAGAWSAATTPRPTLTGGHKRCATRTVTSARPLIARPFVSSPYMAMPAAPVTARPSGRLRGALDRSPAAAPQAGSCVARGGASGPRSVPRTPGTPPAASVHTRLATARSCRGRAPRAGAPAPPSTASSAPSPPSPLHVAASTPGRHLAPCEAQQVDNAAAGRSAEALRTDQTRCRIPAPLCRPVPSATWRRVWSPRILRLCAQGDCGIHSRSHRPRRRAESRVRRPRRPGGSGGRGVSTGWVARHVRAASRYPGLANAAAAHRLATAGSARHVHRTDRRPLAAIGRRGSEHAAIGSDGRVEVDESSAEAQGGEGEWGGR